MSTVINVRCFDQKSWEKCFYEHRTTTESHFHVSRTISPFNITVIIKHKRCIISINKIFQDNAEKKWFYPLSFPKKKTHKFPTQWRCERQLRHNGKWEKDASTCCGYHRKTMKWKHVKATKCDFESLDCYLQAQMVIAQWRSFMNSSKCSSCIFKLNLFPTRHVKQCIKLCWEKFIASVVWRDCFITSMCRWRNRQLPSVDFPLFK